MEIFNKLYEFIMQIIDQIKAFVQSIRDKNDGKTPEVEE